MPDIDILELLTSVERRELLRALTPDDVAWLRSRGWDGSLSPPRDPYKSGVR